LIEGAAEGHGLGHRFLKHIERTRVLLILVSVDPTPERSPSGDLATLRSELARFDPELAARPAIVAVSKLDLPEARTALTELQAQLAPDDTTVYGFSAATREGLEALLDRVEVVLAEHPLLHKPRAKPLPGKRDRPHGPPAESDDEMDED